MEDIKKQITSKMMKQVLKLNPIQQQFIITMNLDNKDYKLFYSYN